MTPAGDDAAGIADAFDPRPVRERTTIHQGLIWDVVRDRVDLGEAGEVSREYLDHPGAVGILALDDRDRVLLVRQYRHPVRSLLWELPAGLLDVAGEPPQTAAARELAEEADLVAGRWDTLVDWYNSPGGMNEAIRVYLARDLTEVPEHDRHTRHGEELGMITAWVDLTRARDAVLAGRIHNPTSVVGLLAACASREPSLRTSSPSPTHRIGVKPCR
jgi:ADP-ribose pyrophosphatase